MSARLRAPAGAVAVLLAVACLGACGQDPPGTVHVAPRFDRMALARHGHRIERVGDRLIAFGGFAHGRATDRGMRQCFSFDLPNGPWVERAPMVRGRAFFGSGASEGAVHALAEQVERYDVGRDRWEVVREPPLLVRSHMGSALVGGRVHVLGGYPVEAAGHWVFDIATGALDPAPSPPGFTPGDHFPILASLRGRLHVVGGISGETSEISDAHASFDGARWLPRASPPTQLWAKFAAHAVVGDTLYVFAEEGNLAYDASADHWRAVAAMPEIRAMPASVVLDGRIVVIGGQPLGGGGRDVLVYDPVGDRWARHGSEESGAAQAR